MFKTCHKGGKYVYCQGTSVKRLKSFLKKQLVESTEDLGVLANLEKDRTTGGHSLKQNIKRWKEGYTENPKDCRVISNKWKTGGRARENRLGEVPEAMSDWQQFFQRILPSTLIDPSLAITSKSKYYKICIHMYTHTCSQIPEACYWKPMVYLYFGHGFFKKEKEHEVWVWWEESWRRWAKGINEIKLCCIW